MTTITDDRTRDETLARIKEALGPKGWSDAPDVMEPLLIDGRGLYKGRAALVAYPQSTAEVARLVAACAEGGIPMVPQGGNTSLCGGATPFDERAVLINLKRMNRIRALDAVNDAMTVEAGCILADLQRAADEADRLFPLSLGAEGSCQIGGNLSTNAGGNAVLRYGMARDLVLGLEVVLPDGRVLDDLTALRKDNTGYNLRHLFIGGEGTLGIITAAVLKLFAKPRVVETAFVALRDPAAAIELLGRTKAGSGDTVVAFELIGRTALDMVLRHIPGTSSPLQGRHEWYVLTELAGGDLGGALRERLEAVLAQAAEDGLVADAAFADSVQQRRALWKIRESINEAQKPEGGSIKHDVSVPISKVAQFIAEASAATIAAQPGLRVVAFGHVGDGNIHFNLSQPAQWPHEGPERTAFMARWQEFNDIVHGIVARHHGSISAEHGIGILKREELTHYKSAVALDVMRALKRALDPRGLMNPGKVV
jgi:FAD/FMN-containing dehydrogenase